MELFLSPDFLNDMPAAFAVVRPYADDDGEPRGFMFIYANEAFARLCGVRRTRLCGADFARVFPSGDFSWVRLCAQAAFGAEKLRFVQYSKCLDKMLSVSAYHIAPDMCGCTLRDITEQRKITAQRRDAANALRRAAETDSLTGLYNAGAGCAMAQSMLDNAGAPCALYVFDMDDFKRINDTMGHASGDEALCVFADVLKQNFRAGDILWRHGGDEFAAIMEGGGRRLMYSKCAKIQAQLLQRQNSISCSIGAVYGRGEFSRMFEAADAALYETKASGKCGSTVISFCAAE